MSLEVQLIAYGLLVTAFTSAFWLQVFGWRKTGWSIVFVSWFALIMLNVIGR